MKKTQRDVTNRGMFDARLNDYTALSAVTLAVAGAIGASGASAQTITNVTAANFGGTLPSLTLSGANASPAGVNFVIGPAHLQFFGTHLHTNATYNGTLQLRTGGTNVMLMRNASAHPNGSHTSWVGNLAAGGHIATSPQAGGHLLFHTRSSSNHAGAHAVGSFDPITGNHRSGYVAFVQVAGGHFYYGWLHLDVTEDGSGRPATIALTPGTNTGNVVAAYNRDASILTGQIAAIPEPASVATGLALFALGAAGVREHRRRKLAA